MSPRNDQYEDNPYAKDEGRRWLPHAPSWGLGGAIGVSPFTDLRDEEEAHYDDEAYEVASDSPQDRNDNESLWDEGLITLLIVGGVILFLFPEPVTSALGILLLAIGVIAWLVNWAR